jgi:hypothetical protein
MSTPVTTPERLVLSDVSERRRPGVEEPGGPTATTIPASFVSFSGRRPSTSEGQAPAARRRGLGHASRSRVEVGEPIQDQEMRVGVASPRGRRAPARN